VWCGVVCCGIELTNGRGHGEVCLEEKRLNETAVVCMSCD
jgi:hypothetical protein